MTQDMLILRHLKERGSITPLEALYLYGCMRLGARIWELRQAGHKIKKVMVSGKNRRGESVTFAKYYMEAEE